LFGDTNVRSAPEINVEEIIREKKTITGQPSHAEDVTNTV
jgi:hypothetical protein